MDWKSLGGELIRKGAPVIGTAMGGPMGGMIGGMLGDILARSLGVENTPEAIDTAIKTMPADELAAKLSQAESEVTAKYAYLGKMAEVQANVATKAVEEVNETIRGEASKVDGWWGNWRLLLAWTLVMETMIWPPVMVYCIVFAPASLTALMAASGIIIAWWGARFGVLGVHVWTGSNERQAIVTGESPSVVKTIAKAINGKK